MRIAYLDPVPAKAAEELIKEELKKYAEQGTEVSYHTLDGGADNYEYAVYEAFMLPHILNKVKLFEELGYDAMILGCFYDPGLDGAKEYAKDIVVVGAAEQEIEKAISEDKAEAIVLACTMEAGKFRRLQEKFGIPVIDPSVAALKMAEYLVHCKRQCGWAVSKIGTYESPPDDELKSFDF